MGIMRRTARSELMWDQEPAVLHRAITHIFLDIYRAVLQLTL